jgi:NAD(P)-dependent dehydrogenase (short-subunit alcohol dehydrogenase family)
MPVRYVGHALHARGRNRRAAAIIPARGRDPRTRPASRKPGRGDAHVSGTIGDGLRNHGWVETQVRAGYFPDMDLHGRVVVITGASRGIGAGLAEELAARGMRLALCARGPSQLPPGADGLAMQLDVTDAGAVHRFAAAAESRLGAIDLWINNAAVLEPIAPLREIEPAAFLDHLRINVMGVVHGSQAYIAHVRRRGGQGVLMNISSGAAWKGYAGWAPYCASKAAVDRISETIQLEEADHLRVYAVAPGVIDTDMQALIRSCTPEQFPLVQLFQDMKAHGTFNSIRFLAEHLLRYAFDPGARPEEVVVRVPSEHEQQG